MFMRPILGMLLALTVLLTGCGSDGADEKADDPATEETSSSPTAGDDPSENDVLALVSESDVGGEVSPEAVSLATATFIADFAAQFEDERMGASISAALADHPVADDQTVVGAVVAIGCEPPTDVAVERGYDGVEITADPVKSDQQCLVPVTTVALVAVSAG